MKENELKISKNLLISKEYKFLDVSFTIILALFHLLDTFTDIILVAEYFMSGFSLWAWTTLLLFAIPVVIVQSVSLHWIGKDIRTEWHWIVHICCLGMLDRYFRIVILGSDAQRSKDETNRLKIYAAQNDLSLLLLFEAFLSSAPQLLLQLFIICSHVPCSFTVVSVIASSAVLALSLVAYGRTQNLNNSNLTSRCLGIFFQSVWHLSMLTARICSLVLLLVCFHSWFLLFISVHWFSMFLWIIYQETDFSDNLTEKYFYNGIAAVIYCYCFFNLKHGKSRWKFLCFYSLTLFENLTCLTVFLMWFSEKNPYLGTISFSIVVGGTILGFISMTIYYRFFHSAKPVAWCDSTTTTSQQSMHSTLRTLKCLNPKVMRAKDDAATESVKSDNLKICLSDSKLMLSDSVVIVEETDMEDAHTLHGWLKEAVNEQQLKRLDLDEVASSVLSAHDYENLAAVNIARGGGLRSWRGYFDIENCSHDGSVVRDATSTTTSTSQSYIDSIAEEYVECKLSTDPVGMFAPSTLDTILEEAESSCSERSPNNGTAACTLVATIDQIRLTTPVQDERSSRVRRKFSLIRERFECRRDVEPPAPVPWCSTPQREQTASPRRLSVKEMRAFFLKQVFTPPKLSALRYKVSGP